MTTSQSGPRPPSPPRFDPRKGPLVIADYADNPGAGGYGDSTALLGALLEAGVKQRLLRADGGRRGGSGAAPGRQGR